MGQVYDLTIETTYRFLRALQSSGDSAGRAVVLTYSEIWRCASRRPSDVSARAWVLRLAAISAAKTEPEAHG